MQDAVIAMQRWVIITIGVVMRNVVLLVGCNCSPAIVMTFLQMTNNAVALNLVNAHGKWN